MYEIGMVVWRSKPQLVDRLFSFMWRQLAYMLYLAAIFNIVFEFKVIVEAFQKFAKSIDVKIG